MGKITGKSKFNISTNETIPFRLVLIDIYTVVFSKSYQFNGEGDVQSPTNTTKSSECVITVTLRELKSLQSDTG